MTVAHGDLAIGAPDGVGRYDKRAVVMVNPPCGRRHVYTAPFNIPKDMPGLGSDVSFFARRKRRHADAESTRRSGKCTDHQYPPPPSQIATKTTAKTMPVFRPLS